MPKPKTAVTKTGDARTNWDKEDSVVSYVRREYRRFADARQEVEDLWLEAWATYLGTPQSTSYIRQRSLFSVGNVNTDWRHKLNTGKAYETVETIHAYLMTATFPNRDWFNAVPQAPGEDNLLTARLIKRHVQDKLTEGKFRAVWEGFLRQLLITGNSVIALPWRVETAKVKKWQSVRVPVFEDEPEFEVVEEEVEVSSCPEFETLDMFDCYFDPLVPDPNKGNFIRRLTKTKAEVLNLLKEGFYYGTTEREIVEATPLDNNYDGVSEKDDLTMFQGITVSGGWSPGHTIELIEFWGDIHLEEETHHNVVVTMCGDNLLRFEPNPYWCGKPFVVGTHTPVSRQPYAMGALQPNLGMLHELNIITNQRLDNLEIAIDQMYTLRSDGLLQPEDVFTEPGKVFLVSDHNDLQAMNSGGLTASVTYQEASYLESTIDKNFGTGNYVGANSARAGERVTAEEVAAVREAGGNRLNGVHKHIEDTTLLVVLEKLMHCVRQFTTKPQSVRVAAKDAGAYDYYELGVEDLGKPIKLIPVGSDHVLERKAYIEDRLAFVQSVAQIPEMAQMVDYKRMMTDLLQHWGFEEPEAYLKAEQEAPTEDSIESVPDVPDTEQMLNEAQDIGGQGMRQVLNQNMQADGGMTLAQDVSSVPLNLTEVQPGQ